MPRKQNSRSYDKESGLNRVSGKKAKGRAPPPPESESEEYISSDSELESELEMPAKDSSRARKAAPPPMPQKSKKDGRSKFIKGEADTGASLEADKKQETDTAVAPHMMLLLAATYHIGISSISRPAISSFIPYAGNFFAMVEAVCSLVSHNTLLHEFCPEFFSPVIYLYYSHVYYYQILRARLNAGNGILTRVEKRILVQYEKVGPPEAWPICAPLIGFIQQLGAHKPADPYFSWIVPSLPNFAPLAVTGHACLYGLNLVVGAHRVPLVPAYTKLLRNFGSRAANFANGQFRPVGQDAIDATHQFCGLEGSAATSAGFQSMSFNSAWLQPAETGDNFGTVSVSVKQNRIRRWNVPDVPENADLTNLQNFLQLGDTVQVDWMRHVLAQAAAMNRFFPGSTNLSQIPLTTHLGSMTSVSYTRGTVPTATANEWWQFTHGQSLEALGNSNTEQGLIEMKLGICASVNSSNASGSLPAAAGSSSPARTGPFFNDDTTSPDTERKAVLITECHATSNPVSRFEELLASYYDNTGGRK